MPTNLPAEAKAKWIKVMEARTTEEKIAALEEFLSSVPKHKGTENLRHWASRRLAELREELEQKKKRRTGGGLSFFIEKEGSAQICVVGPPNSGKSLLVNKLTGAKTVVADYEFSTIFPVPGMLRYEDVLFQLIDTPPLALGSRIVSKIIGLARNSDALLIVLDATRDLNQQFDTLKQLLESEGILLSKPRGRVVIETFRSGKTGIRVTLMGRLLDGTSDDVRKLLESYKIYNAHVKIYGEVSVDDVEQALFENITYKPSIVFINKVDLRRPDDSDINELRKRFNGPIIIGSAVSGLGLDKIGHEIFNYLELVRVYTKAPNTPPSQKPLVLRRGATIQDVALNIHKDFVERFQYARVWGPSAKYPGERVGLEHVVEDKDIVEIHI
ncbi:MAG: GTP-binding protein, partial [Thermosphaera sp.]